MFPATISSPPHSQLCNQSTVWHTNNTHKMYVLSPGVQDAGCVELDEEADSVASLPAGKIASFFYLKHATMATWSRGLAAHMEPREVDLLLWDLGFRV